MEKKRIVIVDDSIFSISILRDMLEANGFEVAGDAGTLEDTIEVVKTTRPDLVTMDMTMPGTDGLQCTRAIHAVDNKIKVVIVSSMKDEEIIKKAKAVHVAGYVQKPVDEGELITTINRILAGDNILKELNEIFLTIMKESFADSLNRLTKHIPNEFIDVDSEKNVQSRGISVVIGIIGKCSGRMIIDLSFDTAQKIAAAAMKKEAPSKQECLAMIGEFTNIVAGNACSILNRRDPIYGLRVAPPTIFHGDSLNISKITLPTTAVTAQTQFGEIYLDVGFKRGDDEWM